MFCSSNEANKKVVKCCKLHCYSNNSIEVWQMTGKYNLFCENVGYFIEKVVSVGSRKNSGSTLDGGISEARLSPMLDKCRFN